jgi:hypothetical protein
MVACGGCDYYLVCLYGSRLAYLAQLRVEPVMVGEAVPLLYVLNSSLHLAAQFFARFLASPPPVKTLFQKLPTKVSVKKLEPDPIGSVDPDLVLGMQKSLQKRKKWRNFMFSLF